LSDGLRFHRRRQRHRRKTDENGKATLLGVYYLFGIGRFEDRALVWNVKVEIKVGDNSVTLDRRNGTLVEK
jgi:hypothetical protein